MPYVSLLWYNSAVLHYRMWSFLSKDFHHRICSLFRLLSNSYLHSYACWCFRKSRKYSSVSTKCLGSHGTYSDKMLNDLHVCGWLPLAGQFAHLLPICFQKKCFRHKSSKRLWLWRHRVLGNVVTVGCITAGVIPGSGRIERSVRFCFWLILCCNPDSLRRHVL